MIVLKDLKIDFDFTKLLWFCPAGIVPISMAGMIICLQVDAMYANNETNDSKPSAQYNLKK